MRRQLKQIRSLSLLASACIGLTLAAAPAAAGPQLYGVEFSGPTPLYSVSQTAGTISAVGPAFNDNVGDLTSDTRAGSARMWGMRIASNELLSIDPLTGAQIGAVAINTNAAITSLAFDVVTGRLFGNTTVGFGDVADTLYEIDPLTGNATLIGAIGFSNVFALGFDQLGNLFGISDSTDDLISISTALGTGTFVADIGLSLAFDIASRPGDNVMFLADSGTSSLYTLDTSNGVTTLVGAYGSPTNIVGLAFAVPAPGMLWLIAIGALGFLRFRPRAR